MPRTRAADYDQQRNAILTVAARLFAQRGYPSASISELAVAGGMSKALMYHYYRDKEQLLFDIADRYLDGLAALVDEVSAQVRAEALAPAAHLRRLIERFMEAYRDAGAHHRVLVQDVKYLSSAHRRRIDGKQRAIVQAFADAIAAAAPELKRSALLKPVTMTLFGMMNWTFTWLDERGAVSYPQMAQVVADLFLRGVVPLQANDGARGVMKPAKAAKVAKAASVAKAAKVAKVAKAAASKAANGNTPRSAAASPARQPRPARPARSARLLREAA
jgi:AcrR family transcriptional regulator